MSQETAGHFDGLLSCGPAVFTSSASSLRESGGAVVRAGSYEGFDGFDRLNAAPGTDCRAVESSSGTGEVELAVERPVLQEAVDEAGVEDVASAGGVDDGDAIGGGGVEVPTVPSDDALLAEGGGGEAAAVAAMHLLEGSFEVGVGHEAGGKVAADDEVVDIFEEVFDAGVELVEVADDGDACGLGPACGDGCGGGVVAVDVEGAGVDDRLAIEVGGLEDEAVVAAAEDGALAVGIDEDEGLGAGSAGDGGDMGFYAGVGEGFVVQGCGSVVAEFADVARAQAPVLAGDDGGRDLSAGKDAGAGVFGLRASGGVGWERDNGIGSVEADADEVDL
jgi:hypothetical protein